MGRYERESSEHGTGIDLHGAYGLQEVGVTLYKHNGGAIGILLRVSTFWQASDYPNFDVVSN